MRAVWVDPAGRTAWVQGGALWGDVDHETQAHGLATTGGIIGHTGVAGLTLGGGIGFLMRKHGLAVDNLLAAEVVTAEGGIVRASANEHPDHDTIAHFRKRFLPQIESLFVEVLKLARTMGMLKMGTVALDGTKIHANASRARGAKGSEVYFLSYQASDDDSRRIAQLEGAAEPLPEAAVGTDLALILWDMAQAEHLEESSALASRIQEELAVVTGSEGRGVKQAPFRVLVGASMPAVLVEIAFISNPEEEKLLASEAYQAKIAASLARGIERYRRERSVRLSGPRAVTSATP